MYSRTEDAIKQDQDIKEHEKGPLGTLVIKQVSRVFALSFEIDLIRAVFSKTNAKALLTTYGHQKRFALCEARFNPRLVPLLYCIYNVLRNVILLSFS